MGGYLGNWGGGAEVKKRVFLNKMQGGTNIRLSSDPCTYTMVCVDPHSCMHTGMSTHTKNFLKYRPLGKGTPYKHLKLNRVQ